MYKPVHYILTCDMIPIYQCDCQPHNPPGILNGTFQGVLFLFRDSACSGRYHIKKTMERNTAAAAASTQLVAKQNRKTKT